MAVCSGGAALVRPHGSGASYEELLGRVPSGLELIVAIICGNDFYNGYAVVDYRSELDVAARALCHGMKARSSNQYAVVGGSAEIWGYARRQTRELCAMYDYSAERL
eukprot:11362767-Karenia_brevis.AAC.1